MKNSKVFVALGSLALTVAGFVAVKANKKVMFFNTAVAPGLATVQIQGSHIFSTTKVNSSYNTAFFKTASSAAVTLLTSAGGNKVYFR